MPDAPSFDPDVVLAKCEAIERNVRRARDKHAGDDARLLADPDVQDVVVLVVTRACEAAIDLAMHAVRVRRLGVPKDSKDAFELMAAAGILDRPLADRLKKMVGFRNVAVHQYARIDYARVASVVRRDVDDLLVLSRLMLSRLPPPSGGG